MKIKQTMITVILAAAVWLAGGTQGANAQATAPAVRVGTNTYHPNALTTYMLENADTLVVTGTWSDNQLYNLQQSLRPSDYTTSANTHLKHADISAINFVVGEEVSLRRLFQFCKAMTTVVMPPPGSISNPVDLSELFYQCISLETADLSAFTCVQTFAGTFGNCESLKSVILPNGSSYEREQVGVDFQSAFQNCASLEGPIDLTAFTNASCFLLTFSNCKKLKGVKMPTSTTTTFHNFLKAFENCESLEGTVDLSAFANSSSCEQAFYKCYKLKEVILCPASTYTGTSGVSFRMAFYDCISLEKTLNLSGFSNVSTFEFAFYNCKNLRSILLPESSAYTRGFVDFGEAFFGCASLEGPIDLSGFAGTTRYWGAFFGCGKLTAVMVGVAKPDFPTYFKDANPNCLKYLPLGMTELPEGWEAGASSNFIFRSADGTTATAADTIVLVADRPFRCPQAFSVATPGYGIVYTRDFGTKESGTGGECKGWETLCLPFTPTEVLAVNAEGNEVRLTPFRADGTYDDTTEGTIPFWLRKLDAGKYRPAAQIEPDVPYILALPNNPAYRPAYNVTDTVIFQAVATADAPVVVPATKDTALIGESYTLHTCYDTILASPTVYVIDEPGTAYVANGGDALPFRPYVTANDPSAAPPRFDLADDDDPTGIEQAILTGRDADNNNYMFRDAEGNLRDGILRVYSAGADAITVEARGAAFANGNTCRVTLHSADGRAVRLLTLHEGANRVTGLPAGVYLLSGRKTIIQ